MLEITSDADDNEIFGLTWPGKRAARLAATVPASGQLVAEHPGATNQPATVQFITGDNLAALKLLLPTQRGQVKLIYIDPPYNTGNTFVFQDKFAARSKRTGDVIPEAGRLHTAWLSMMFPRLLLARELLREDGAIFVSIGPEELHNLLALLHEVFGEGCFKNIIVVRRGVKNVQAQFATIDALNRGHEYVVFFSASPKTRYPKLLIAGNERGPARGGWNNHWRGTERPTMRYPVFGIVPARGQWRWGEERSNQAIQNYHRLCFEVGNGNPDQAAIDAWALREQTRTGQKVDLLRLSRSGKPEHFVPPAAGKLASDLWTDLKPNGTAQLRRLFGEVKVFDTPKSVDLIARIVEFAAGPEDVILDFFAGTCTSAQAVLERNAADNGQRRCICVQAPDPLPTPILLPEGTQLTTIAAIGQERIRRVLALLGKDAGELALWRVE